METGSNTIAPVSAQQSYRQYVKLDLCFSNLQQSKGFATVGMHFSCEQHKTFDAIRSTAFPFSWQTPDLVAFKNMEKRKKSSNGMQNSAAKEALCTLLT